jgi:LmbE family N-acetylglucosaminyl deacetylase
MLRLLCVTAHPDDEIGPFGGSLMSYRERGVETHVLCLTPGQAGSHRGSASTGEELAQIRRAEFFASCEILRVSHAVILDYPDGGLDRTNFHDIVGVMVAHLRRIRPHVVLTLGPEGAINAHPDHTMASIFTTAAFHWAGRANRYTAQLASDAEPHITQPHITQKLYYSTTNFALTDRPSVSPTPVTATIDIEPYFEFKFQAFHAHRTQAPIYPFFEKAVRTTGSQELFHLAAASTPRLAGPETDLFAGVVENPA